MRTELGPAQCYSTDPVGFRQPRRCSDCAVSIAPERLRCRRRVSLLLHVPTMQPVTLPSLTTRWSSPLLFIPSPLYPAHPHTPVAESTTAPLRSVTPHHKPTTALPTEPSTSTTDRSSGQSPTTPLRPSCREHLHVHRCLRSSSSPATTL
jgi:hypothetical protein